jgi:protoporphyrinogen oxidase
MTNQKINSPVDVLILGGGLAGLSAAYHLSNKYSYRIIEKENEVGGTARTIKIKNFTFDFTGHLLHLHNAYTKKLVHKLLKNQFYICERKALIYSNDTYTKYPFQANTNGLPENVIEDCILGLLDIHLNLKNLKSSRSNNFLEWCHQTFGQGISRHFMIPYNEKLYQVPCNKMTSDWCGMFVPVPQLSEAIRGALMGQDKMFGYNSTFLYPKKGGIQSLAVNLAKKLNNVTLNTGIESLDFQNKTARLSSGEKIKYRHLINTIPLKNLLTMIPSKPAPVAAASQKLKQAGILCLNLGINRKKISDASWIYFPEKKYLFYRVGFPMNFTPHVVPKGASSMYVEIPMKDIKGFSKNKILSLVRKGLIDAKILKTSDKILVAHYLPISYAYVIYDQNRKSSLRSIFQFLNRNSIQSIGRYGAWKYSFMEEALLDGKKAAEAVHAFVT